MHKKKGYSSNYQEALLYVVCVCYSSIFSAQKKNNNEKKKKKKKYTMYNDMQDGKNKIKTYKEKKNN
jgi:hypothetical protein